MTTIKKNNIRRYLQGFLLLPAILLSANAMARVEFIELSYESNKIKLTIESRAPISFEYYTNEKTRQFGVLLEGDDYYQALTDYFQSIEVEKISQCIDDITIIPISDNAARLEVKLSEGLVASAYDDTANSPRNFRVIVQYVALDVNQSACFNGNEAVLSEQIAGMATAPSVPPAAVLKQDLGTIRPFNASDQDQKEFAPRRKDMDATRINKDRTPMRSSISRNINLSAYVLYDILSYTNKGGPATDWLKQEASSELRAAEISMAGNYSNWEYQLALQAMPNSQHEQTVSLYRASIGVGTPESQFSARAGIIAEPFGGAVANGLENLPFLERSLAANLANEYNPGVKIQYNALKELSLEFGVFGKRPSSGEPSSKQSTTLRALYTPYRIGESELTLGFSYRQWKPVDNTFSLAARPESHIILPRFTISQTEVSSVTTNGFNMFMNIGDLMLSAESITSTFGFESTAPSASVTQVSARSLWGSWFITGEKRRIFHGQLQRITPLNQFKLGGEGWGAFEVGLRMSQISDNKDQKLSATSIGAVWYLNDSLQFKATWVFSVHSATDNIVDYDADIIEFRAQYQY